MHPDDVARSATVRRGLFWRHDQIRPRIRHQHDDRYHNLSAVALDSIQQEILTWFSLLASSLDSDTSSKSLESPIGGSWMVNKRLVFEKDDVPASRRCGARLYDDLVVS